MSDYETSVRTAVSLLKKEEDVFIQGRNPNIEDYYAIWRGIQNWLNYRYKLTNGQVVEAKLKTLNIPRYLCRTWANNYANEGTVLTIPNDASNNRLQEILADTNFFGRFNNFAEMFMGLGIGATIVEIDVLVNEETKEIQIDPNADIKIKMVPGRRIIPITVDDGEVTECAFISFFTGGARLTIHYLVDDEYYVAIFTAKGKNGNYTWDWEKYTSIPTKANKDTPLFQIWKPNLTDEDEIDKSIGTSIFSDAIDTFKHLDLGYTAYYKEVKLGQKVKFMSTDTQDFDENGNLIVPFDEEDESIIFIKDANNAGSKMQEFNGELRIEAITKYINTNLNCAAMLCGLGQTQFEFDGGAGRPIQTARGVIAKQTELYRNVVKQENLATSCFQKLVMAIAHMNNTFTNKPKITIKKKKDIQVVYDDNIVEDTASKKQSELQEVQAGVLSIAEFRSHWYDEDYDSSLKFVQENGMLLDKYILALQAKVITPAIFVELTFGENFKYKKELIAYIEKQYAAPTDSDNTGFEDEDAPEDKENEDEDDE